VSLLALETDQYDLPPRPLADIGPEVAAHVELKLRAAVDKVNAEIESRERCIETVDGKQDTCGDPISERIKLEYLLSEDAIAHEAFAQLGDGFPPFTQYGNVDGLASFMAQPARYHTSLWKSIFILILV